MTMTAEQLSAAFEAGRNGARQEMEKHKEDPMVLTVGAFALLLLHVSESVVLDLRRSADALERLAEDQRELDNYRRCYGSMKYGPET